MPDLSRNEIEELLAAAGELLQDQGEFFSIVIVGGAALSLMGLVERTTKDVDVIARSCRQNGMRLLIPPEPLPRVFNETISRVARDFGLPSNWMNTVVGSQWESGLPDSVLDEIEWRQFGNLEVGLMGRKGLIALKLFAAVDRDPDSVHYQDLIALKPVENELQEAKEWVITQDAAHAWRELVEEVVEHVRKDFATD